MQLFSVKIQTSATNFETMTVNAESEKAASIKAREFGMVCEVKQVPKAKVNKMAALLTKENAQNWKTFVADYVVIETAKSASRALVGGYQVKKSGDLYQIVLSGMNPGYGKMTADVLYGWMERLPLSYFAGKADDYRHELLK